MLHGCDHAVDAARARYGVELDDADFTVMVLDIIETVAGARRGGALLLATIRFDREIWLLRIPRGGPAVRVVYIPVAARIVTVLPPVYELPRGGRGDA
jgi:hypothetical protein